MGLTILTFIAIPLTFICWPIGLGALFICGNAYWIINYKIGVSINEKMAKDLEDHIPLYLFLLSLSYNKGIESFKIMKEKYEKIYK